MDFYTNLSHAQYKVLEEDMRAFGETVHTSVEGYYHKSIRVRVGDATFEFHGPAVKAAEVIDPTEVFGERRTGPAERRIRAYDSSSPQRRMYCYNDRRKRQKPAIIPKPFIARP